MNIDWNALGFAYMETAAHIRYVWKDGDWSAGELCSDPHMSMHIAATALHYGQSAFEGLKAFHCQDGRVRVFRDGDNCRRMQATAARVLMEPVPEALFREAVDRVVAANREYVPPYGSGGALYIRPLLFGSGARIGLKPADEYTFLVLVVPVGDYYKGGLSPVSAAVVPGFDRAAPNGVGNVKVAGNYAAGMMASRIAAEDGFPVCLYLDPREHRYVDEFGTSNFVAVTADGAYVTPDSPSVLPSITNMTLMTLAEARGMRVERRPVAFEEIGSFTEVAACGTAVVITPVNRIVCGDTEIRVGPAEGAGPVFSALYRSVRGIQQGEIADEWGWTRVVA